MPISKRFEFPCTGALRLIAVVLVVLSPSTLSGQSSGTIRGRILDDRGMGVPHAEVELRPDNRRLVASATGQFIIQNVEFGNKELRIRRLGYEPIVLPFTFTKADTTLVIGMRVIPVLLDSVRIRERAGRREFTAFVIDDVGTPLPGAQIIPLGMRHLTTDSAGRAIVPDPKRGTLMIRVRKIGYRPFFGAITIEGLREDTIRLERVAQDLAPVMILEESGFGRDTFAYLELESRTKWKANGAGTISREELDSFGKENLCSAMPRTRTGALLGIRDGPTCSKPTCILINGERPLRHPLSQYLASDVEAVEYFPGRTDWSGTIFSRAGITCFPGLMADRGPGKYPGGWVIWLRKR